MPFCPRFEGKVRNIVSHLVCIAVLPRFAMDGWCHERFNVTAPVENALTRINTEFYAVTPHLLPCFTGMDFGIDCNGCKHRIKGTRRRIGHKGIVEGLVVAIARLVVNMMVFLVNLRRLGETGLLFVHRLRY